LIDKENEQHQYDSQLVSNKCTFIKKDGLLCKNSVIIGLPFCRVHAKSAKHLSIRKSEIPSAGLGVFADNGKGLNDTSIIFKKGSILCEYIGERIDEQQLVQRYTSHTAPYAFEIKSHQLYLDGALVRGIGSLINHFPKKANVRFSITRDKKVNIITTKNIKNGKILGKDYKMNEQGVFHSTNQRKRTL
jgi:hypothetical protein